MRVLLLHNHYRQAGGEDACFAAESELLRAHGHQVLAYTEHNRRLGELNPIAAAARTLWSGPSRRAIRRLLEEQAPEVAHFHNTFPLISPAAYYSCRRAGVPVVQTLHNYRLVCPAATLYRGGRPCQDCLGRGVAWPGVLHACYRGSRVQTAVVAGMLALHGLLGTWRDQVDVYIALNEFCRRKFVEAGLPAGRILVKPHFVSPDPGPRRGPGDYALYVGRLSAEKGLRTLLAAWPRAGRLPLLILGDGPLRAEAQAAADRAGAGGVRLLGWRPRAEVFAIMKGAAFLVFPSQWPEPFGLAIIEAFACGLPVIASAAGAPREIVEDGRTGLHFAPGDAQELAARAAWLGEHPAEGWRMGREARREFEARYTAESNYPRLLEIYRAARAGLRGWER